VRGEGAGKRDNLAPVEALTTPYLLLSAPDLLDPNFARTVVLMGHHSNEGALGWIVNRVLAKKAAGVLPPPMNAKVHPDTPLRLGGPVLTDGLIVVFRGEAEGIESVEMAPGLSISAAPEILPKLFGDLPDGEAAAGLLVFGYAGWGPGQLEHEMEEGSWLVLPYDETFAFSSDPTDLWEKALARLGVDPGSVVTPPGGVN
jgi:putative transcriptional regulator